MLFRFGIAAAVFVCGSVLANSSSMAENSCNVRGPWNIVQSNGPTVRINLSQDEGSGALSGTARSDDVSGNASGRIQGRAFELTINWSNGQLGQYTGVIGNGDRIKGTTADATNPSSVATWNAGQKSFFGCP
jgi:hypothetical protein